MVTNRLNWMIIAGGIEISSTFDYEVDYGITDTIRIPYSIDTGINGTITTYLTIDNNTTEYTSVNGNNFIDLLGSDLGLGTHSVELYSTVDKYTSNKITFNLVIISTSELSIIILLDANTLLTETITIAAIAAKTNFFIILSILNCYYLLLFTLFCGFIIEPAIHSCNLHAKK